MHGDGGKRMLLMVAAGLRAALRESEPVSFTVAGPPRMARLCHALSSLQVCSMHCGHRARSACTSISIMPGLACLLGMNPHRVHHPLVSLTAHGC